MIVQQPTLTLTHSLTHTHTHTHTHKQTNKQTNTSSSLDIPFIPITCVDGFGSSVVVAYAMVLAQNTKSFKWVLQHMKDLIPPGGHLDSIITDEDAAMAAAIREVFPNSTHMLCKYYFIQFIHFFHLIQFIQLIYIPHWIPFKVTCCKLQSKGKISSLAF